MVVLVCSWSTAVVQCQESSSSSMDESITPTPSSTWQGMAATTSTVGDSGQSPTATASTYTTASVSTTATAMDPTTTATVAVNPSAVSQSTPGLYLPLSSLLQLYGGWLNDECNKTCCGQSGVTLNKQYVQRRVCNAGADLCRIHAHLGVQNATCPTCKDGKCVFPWESGAVVQRPLIILIFSAMLLILGYLTV